MSGQGWFEETLHADLGQRLRIDRIVRRERTAHQDLLIFEHARLGRVMALDGVVQLTEGDEFSYHEMMAHVPMLAHGAVGQVLIVGGGDGGVLRRCLEHQKVRRAVLVELDRAVIDLVRAEMPSVCAHAFDDPRTEIVIADGARYVAETADRFDLIVVDSTDPFGPGAVLFTPDFYRACRRCLRPGGILVTQSGVPFVQPDEFRHVRTALRAVFPVAAHYLVSVPSYYGGAMALGFATDDQAFLTPPLATLEARFAGASLATRYYTPAIHLASFALPAWLNDLAG